MVNQIGLYQPSNQGRWGLFLVLILVIILGLYMTIRITEYRVGVDQWVTVQKLIHERGLRTKGCKCGAVCKCKKCTCGGM